MAAGGWWLATGGWWLPADAGVIAAQACSFAPGVRPGGRVTFFWAQKKVTKEEGLNATPCIRRTRCEDTVRWAVDDRQK